MVLQTAATLSETALILATQQTFSCIAAARPLLLLHLVDKTSKTVLGSFRFIQIQPSHAMENEFTLTIQLARTAQKLVLLKSMSY